MLAPGVICCSHQSDRRIRLCVSHHKSVALEYVSRTNQIAALQYDSRTNHITAFGYLVFGYSFPVNDFMESGSWCTKNGVNQKFWVHLVSVMVVAFVQALSIEVENNRDIKGSVLFLLQYHFFFTYARSLLSLVRVYWRYNTFNLLFVVKYVESYFWGD